MSGIFDKKTEKTQRREERSRIEQQGRKKARQTTIIVIVVFALLLGGSLFINSKYVRRSLTAITIGGVNFSAAEFDYLYSMMYRDYANYLQEQFGSYASMYLPAAGRTHSSQVYDHDTGKTWAEFFTEYTIERTSEAAKYYNAAKAAGYVLPEEARKLIDDEIELYKTYAKQENLSLNAFIQRYIGLYLNEALLRRTMEILHTASFYSANYRKTLSYTEAQLAEYYSEHKNSFDSLTFRLFQVTPETTVRENYATEYEYQVAAAAALQQAYQRAALIAAGIDSEESFIEAVRDYYGDEKLDTDFTLGTYPSGWLTDSYISDLAPWLQDMRRAYGNVTSIDVDSGSYIVFFVNRDNNQYRMTEMRQILFLRDSISEEMFHNHDDGHGHTDDDFDEAAYIEARESADAEVRRHAETVVRMFIEGGATEAVLLELMAEFSDDPTEGGFYDLISKNAANRKMVPEIEAWLFAPGRKAGDYELIRTEAYGYHFVYFVGHGERYCDYLALEGLRDSYGSTLVTGMRDRDYAVWTDRLKPAEAVKQWAFMFVQK